MKRSAPGPTAKTQRVASEATVLTKAVLRAAAQLDMSGKALAAVIGVSEATLSRMRSGEHVLTRKDKPFELGVLFVRLFRSLDAIVGGDQTVARTWLTAHNTALSGTPLALIQTVSGLMNVINYLDARRAVV